MINAVTEMKCSCMLPLIGYCPRLAFIFPRVYINGMPLGSLRGCWTSDCRMARLCFSLAVGYENVRGQLRKKGETPTATNVSTSADAF